MLLGDDPSPPDKQSRRARWVDPVGLVAIVAGMIAVGLLGDRGQKDPAPEPTTTTAVAQTSTTAVVGPGTGTPPSLDGGPLLDRGKRTVLFLESPTPRIVDIGAGTVRELAPLGTPPLVVALEHGFVVPRNGTKQLVRLSTGGDEVGTLDVQTSGLLRATDGSWWSIQDRGFKGFDLVELDEEFRFRERLVHIPRGAGVVGATTNGFVVGHFNSITVVDPDTGEPRDLGRGDPIAAHGRTIARFVCRSLRCTIELVDSQTGRAAAIADLPDVQSYVRGQFSHDGRWFAVIVNSTDDAALLLIDTTQRRAQKIRQASDNPIAFSADDDYLFVVADGALDAYELETGAWSKLPIDVTGVRQIAVTGR